VATLKLTRISEADPRDEKSSKWLVRSKENLSASCRLLCLPYAGGSASIFHKWSRLLPEFDVVAIQPPGRANRLAEPVCKDMSSYVEGLLPAVITELDRPWMMFGHSMGALAGYELLARLHDLGHPMPSHFFISASRGPQVKGRISPISDLQDAEFIQELKKLNGTPAQVLENRELIQFCLPFIRADFRLVENYLIESFDPLPVKPVLLCGVEDSITPNEMELWNVLFKSPGKLTNFPGDHFFLHDTANLRDITALIKQESV